jgi:hypothetical protein
LALHLGEAGPVDVEGLHRKEHLPGEEACKVIIHPPSWLRKSFGRNERPVGSVSVTARRHRARVIMMDLDLTALYRSH